MRKLYLLMLAVLLLLGMTALPLTNMAGAKSAVQTASLDSAQPSSLLWTD